MVKTKFKHFIFTLAGIFMLLVTSGQVYLVFKHFSITFRDARMTLVSLFFIFTFLFLSLVSLNLFKMSLGTRLKFLHVVTLGRYSGLVILALLVINVGILLALPPVSRAQAVVKCFTRAQVAGACFTATPHCRYIMNSVVYSKGTCTYPNWEEGAHNCKKGPQFCYECGSDVTNAAEFVTPTNQVYPPYAAICAAVGITDCTIKGLHNSPLFKWFSDNLDGFVVGETPDCPGPSPTPLASPSPSAPVYTINDLKTLLRNYLGVENPLYLPRDGKTNIFDATYLIRLITP